jgi:hypothetical protein
MINTVIAHNHVTLGGYKLEEIGKDVPTKIALPNAFMKHPPLSSGLLGDFILQK